MRNAFSVSAFVVGLALVACSPEARDYGTGGGGAGGTGGAGGSGGDACDPGTANCDGAPGCETDVTDDAANCGGCSVRCQLECSNSACNDPVQIVAGYRHSCVRTALGDVYCWGNNSSYELGIGDMLDQFVPQKVAVSGKAVHIDAGGGAFTNAAGADQIVAHTCAVLEDTTVQCWGANTNGQLGTSNGNWQDKPTTAVSLVGATEVSAGGRHTCAVTNQGELYCWGANDKGQCGLGSTSEKVEVPSLVALTDVAHVSAGYEHTCAVKKDGTLHCWGVNGIYGRLGIGDGPDQLSPKVVSLIGADQISAGYEHTCALKGGKQYCWGNGYQGQLGIDGEFTWRTTPTDASAVPSPISVSSGFQHTASVSGTDGKPYVSSTVVRIGDGTTNTTYVPLPVELPDVVEIAAGWRHTCARTKKGEIHCWGDNKEAKFTAPDMGDEILSPHLIGFLP
ncbi:hypothetical protein [Polyangium sp. y55x31]|uniref:RCC1 domain-containing protein n=1 Tax=Polyangium sp. y55x31 TaxID=3042688 RepID=UPI002482A8BE|nr:hypothetical protein [Polyangium sp. y55x31]MDI1480001.1 hypothetical protein [Polyangium sp. y55x31]